MPIEFKAEVGEITVNGRQVTGWRKRLLALPVALLGLFVALGIAAVVLGGLGLLAALLAVCA